MTRPIEDVEQVFALADQGLSPAEISRRTGVSHHGVTRWLERGRERVLASPGRRALGAPACDRRTCELPAAVTPEPYVYLLGLYLGDGSITVHRREVYRLWIFCDSKYQAIIDQAVVTMRLVMPRTVGLVEREGAVGVNSYSQHWPCLLPQHGPGRKHERKIELASWQQALVTRHPKLLLRGLIHSDGCRDLNPVKGKDYPRYQFSNRSADIRGIFTGTCDLLGVRWRQSNAWTISVARRPDVAFLDTFIGPKC